MKNQIMGSPRDKLYTRKLDRQGKINIGAKAAHSISSHYVTAPGAPHMALKRKQLLQGLCILPPARGCCIPRT